MDTASITQFFASVGVPAILIGFAVFAASRRLSHIATFLVAVTILHFGFDAFWRQMLAMTHDGTHVIGATNVAIFTAPSLHLAVSCARVWLGFADYSPVAHDQVALALRWIIGGTS